MREIKFRAWDFYLKQMVQPSEPVLLNKIIPLLHGDNSLWKSKTDLSGYHLMQFTGLRDKNGVEIYEGDILESEWVKEQGRYKNGDYVRGVVVFKDAKFMVKYDDLYDDLNSCYEDIVAGNIYQNPELLEVKQ